MNEKNADPRLQQRKQPERKVFCKLGGDQSCLVQNLSEDGLCLESLTPIEEKGLLHLRLSVDLNNPIEATGQLAWTDSAKRTGGLRFLELSAPARQQIRAWLGETSAASPGTNGTKVPLSLPTSQKRDKPADVGLAIEKLPAWQIVRVPSMQLVPIERHRSQMRWQFLRGLLLGFGTCAAVMIAAFQYAGGTKLGSLAWTTASPNRPAQSSKVQSGAALTQASVAQPASASTSVSQTTAANLLVREPAARQTVPAAAPQRQRRQTAGPTSTSLTTRPTSLTSATPQSAPEPAPKQEKAEQPLEASQVAVVSAPADSKPHSSSDQVQHAKKLPATPEQLWSSFEAGKMKAAIALADLYARGDGVPVNCEQARILLQVASKKNIAEASEKLQELDKGGCAANSE